MLVLLPFIYRFSFFAFLTAISTISFAASKENQDKSILTTTQECTKLTATGNPEYPPYLFKDSLDPKHLVGANADILKEIAESLDLELDIIYSGPWSRAQQEAREGRIDLLAGAFFTIPRAQYMD